MFVTRKPRGAKPQVKTAEGPAGQSWLAGHTLSQFRPRHGSYVHTSVHKSMPCLRVSGNRLEWSAGHMDGRPTIHHLQTNSIRSVENPFDLYIRVLTVELTHTTLYLQFSTCKGSSLVIEAQAKPCRELRVELSLCSSSESSLGDQ
jgi:hypothetical protein